MKYSTLLIPLGLLQIVVAPGCKTDCAELSVDECAESECGVLTASKIVDGSDNLPEPCE